MCRTTAIISVLLSALTINASAGDQSSKSTSHRRSPHGNRQSRYVTERPTSDDYSSYNYVSDYSTSTYTSPTTEEATQAQPMASVESPILLTTALTQVDTVAPSVLKTVAVCNKTSPKSEIKRFLEGCKADLKAHVDIISSQTDSVTCTNANDTSVTIVSELKYLNSIFQATTGYIRLCGYDPNPLKENSGVSVNCLATAAYDIVLTLQPAFHAVSALYTKYPVIESTCSATLTNVSTSFSTMIGACSEQVNLFDVGFFRLSSSQLQDFADTSNNFAAFVGSFSSRA